MARRKRLIRVLGIALATILIVVLVGPDLWAALQANLDRVRSLRGLELKVHERSLDEAAWDAGWRSLCASEGEQVGLGMPASEQALQFSALASIDRGDYVSARRLLQDLAEQGLAQDEPNTLAYLAALEMDWVEAERAYEPQATPRHERWWGTVFYLAAQQRMFEGEAEEAARLYRRADAAYDAHGPYLGLGLVECLVQQGRSLEAWDAYRRALVVMPPDEALTYLARFEELRLEGLRAWQGLQPENEQVAHWLAFYEADADLDMADSQLESAATEGLERDPAPQVEIEAELESGGVLLGFDYRVEDLETGPFMTVDFYLREGQGEQAGTWRVRQTVLNQAPNGAFAWDAVPDGVRPVGWHGLAYDRNLAALYSEMVVPGEPWLCLDAGRIGTSFGLQSNRAPLSQDHSTYLQGGKVFPVRDASVSVGRTWFGVEDPYNYSYVGGGRRPDQVQSMAGSWEPAPGADSVAVWLMAHQTSKGCFREMYLFALPETTLTEVGAGRQGSRAFLVAEDSGP